MGERGFLGKLFRRKGVEAQPEPPRADDTPTPATKPAPSPRPAPKPRVQDAVPKPTVKRWRKDKVLRQILGPAADVPAVAQILDLCDTGPGPTPPRAWREEMTMLLADSDDGAGIRALRTIALRETPFDDPNTGHRVPFVRTVVWAISLSDPGEAVPLLIRVTELYGKPGRGRDYRSIALAAVEALGRIGGERALPALRQIRAEAKLGDVRRAASRELDQTLGEANLSRADVPEWQAESFGLDRDGRRVLSRDHDHDLIIQLGSDGEVTLLYAGPSGQPQTRKPPIVRADRVREAGEVTAEISRVVYAERYRLKQLMKDQRTLTYEDWAEFYLGNPVTGRLSSALVWESSADGGEHWQRFLPLWSAHRETWVRLGNDGETRAVSVEARVRIADPKGISAAEARTWAAHLRKLKAEQPFKQLDL